MFSIFQVNSPISYFLNSELISFLTMNEKLIPCVAVFAFTIVSTRKLVLLCYDFAFAGYQKNLIVLSKLIIIVMIVSGDP